MNYQFTIKSWNQRSWPKKPQEERLVGNFQEARTIARALAVRDRADVRFNVKGHSKLHYYRLTDLTKKKID